uniref:Phosphoglycerate mutase-like protein n=1 Tax=Noctiluca scintillans TaxID=2966 RepID=A0A7S1FGD6_NOCSC
MAGEVKTDTAKRVALIRHGEGYHNVNSRKLYLGWLWSSATRDTSLTATGEEQARSLQTTLQDDADHPLHKVQVVISSPLQRALQTTRLVFGEGLTPPRCVSPLHTERCILPCDRGRSPQEIASLFPDVKEWEGFDALEPVWWPKTRSEEFWPVDRVESFKRLLLSRSETSLAVVGHAGFFKCFAGVAMHNCEVLWVDVDSSGVRVVDCSAPLHANL